MMATQIPSAADAKHHGRRPGGETSSRWTGDHHAARRWQYHPRRNHRHPVFGSQDARRPAWAPRCPGRRRQPDHRRRRLIVTATGPRSGHAGSAGHVDWLAARSRRRRTCYSMAIRRRSMPATTRRLWLQATKILNRYRQFDTEHHRQLDTGALGDTPP